MALFLLPANMPIKNRVLPVLALALMVGGYLVLQRHRSHESTLPDSYFGKTIRIAVVDDASGSPIANAAVVAQWIMVHPDGFKGAAWYKDLYVVERLTDRSGHATIAEWGPIARPVEWQMVSTLAPKIIVFRPGYAPLFLGSIPPSQSEEAARSALPAEITLRLKTYGEAISGQGGLAVSGKVQAPEFSSPLAMLKVLGGQLAVSVFGADNEEEAIARRWLTIVMADKELQRLSAPTGYRWNHPRIEEILARQTRTPGRASQKL